MRTSSPLGARLESAPILSLALSVSISSGQSNSGSDDGSRDSRAAIGRAVRAMLVPYVCAPSVAGAGELPSVVKERRVRFCVIELLDREPTVWMRRRRQRVPVGCDDRHR